MNAVSDPNSIEEKQSVGRLCIRLFGKTCIYLSTLAFGLLAVLAVTWVTIALFG